MSSSIKYTRPRDDSWPCHQRKGERIVAIAENLKHHRIKRKLSQTELAEISGVSQAQISNIENGNKLNPGVVTIKKLADSLKVSVDKLIK